MYTGTTIFSQVMRHLPWHRDLPPGTSPLSKLDLGPFEVHSMV